jgi:hypothetical protein
MNFYIAVAFFCLNGECAFFKGDTNYYKLEDCEKKVMSVLKDLNGKGVMSEGVCLKVKLDQV